jgi:hypothetical protein
LCEIGAHSTRKQRPVGIASDNLMTFQFRQELAKTLDADRGPDELCEFLFRRNATRDQD